LLFVDCLHWLLSHDSKTPPCGKGGVQQIPAIRTALSTPRAPQSFARLSIRGVPPATLQLADLRPVQTSEEPELFLGDAGAGSRRDEVGREALGDRVHHSLSSHWK
jgi:hypothetical protein